MLDSSQIFTLSPTLLSAGCIFDSIIQKVICQSSRLIVSARSRWWFVVISNCAPEIQAVTVTFEFLFQTIKCIKT